MPAPELAEEEEEEQADDQNDEEETMPEPDDPEEDLEDELNDEEQEEAEQEEDEEEEEEEEEVASATMPEDDDESESSGGILGKIPTRLIIVGSAIAVAGVLVLWFLRGGSGSPQERAREAEEASQQHRTNEEGGMEYSAPPDQPLERDAEMMDALGMGDGMGQ